MLYLSPETGELSRTWATEVLDRHFDSDQNRLQLLAGRAPTDQPDKGAIVCTCFNVDAKQISRAITSGGCTTIDAVGLKLNAGTNCGSCRNEIGVLVKRHIEIDKSLPTG